MQTSLTHEISKVLVITQTPSLLYTDLRQKRPFMLADYLFLPPDTLSELPPPSPHKEKFVHHRRTSSLSILERKVIMTLCFRGYFWHRALIACTTTTCKPTEEDISHMRLLCIMKSMKNSHFSLAQVVTVTDEINVQGSKSGGGVSA